MAAFLGWRDHPVDVTSHAMTTETSHLEKQTSHPGKLRVIIAGGGVAALEATLALGELAPEHTDVTVIAPNTEFAYRPMAVCEPFADGPHHRYPLAPIVRDAGAELLADALAWVDPAGQIAHTEAGEQIAYDALVLALGAKAHQRYPHALTIDASPGRDPARADRRPPVVRTTQTSSSL
jgi:hypothetical protein